MIKEYKGYTPEKGEEYLRFIEEHKHDGCILTANGKIHQAYYIPSKKNVEWCKYIDPKKGSKPGSSGDLRPESVMKKGVVVSTDLCALQNEYPHSELCSICSSRSNAVIPAQAGIHKYKKKRIHLFRWISAFARMIKCPRGDDDGRHGDDRGKRRGL